MSGTIKLTGCEPAIGNDETLGATGVIVIVALIVLAGLGVQWLLGHVNRRAANDLKRDLASALDDVSHIINTHPAEAAAVPPAASHDDEGADIRAPKPRRHLHE